MARTISVADDVFEWLKKEKGNRSYSELLREFREEKNSNFSEVAGMNSLGETSFEEVENAIEEASEEKMKEIYEEMK